MLSNIKRIQLDSNEEFYIICDVYDQSELDTFMSTREPAVIVDIGPTYYREEEIPNHGLYRIPKWIESDASPFYDDVFSTEVETKATFNFMVNKSAIHRYIMIKLLETMNFDTEYYTFSGVNHFYTDQLKILGRYYIDQLKHLPNEIIGGLVKPIKTPPKFFTNENNIVTNYYVTTTGDTSPAYNRVNYNQHLKRMFESTAIALISESIVSEKQANDYCIHFSEKTLFSILGLNFPIWVGGYGQADQWEKLGFDVFKDVINHSYQYKNTLIERCYYALFDNRHLLDNFTLSSTLRKAHMSRLIKNRDILLNGHLCGCVEESTNALPDNIRDYIKNMDNIWFDSFDSKQ